jgi:predicted sulfurtransferase
MKSDHEIFVYDKKYHIKADPLKSMIDPSKSMWCKCLCATNGTLLDTVSIAKLLHECSKCTDKKSVRGFQNQKLHIQ